MFKEYNYHLTTSEKYKLSTTQIKLKEWLYCSKPTKTQICWSHQKHSLSPQESLFKRSGFVKSTQQRVGVLLIMNLLLKKKSQNHFQNHSSFIVKIKTNLNLWKFRRL